MHNNIIRIAGVDFAEVEFDVLLPAHVESVTIFVPLGPNDTLPGEEKIFEVYLGAALGVFVYPIAYANVNVSIPGEYNTNIKGI